MFPDFDILFINAMNESALLKARSSLLQYGIHNSHKKPHTEDEIYKI